jgi:hypothetical protein
MIRSILAAVAGYAALVVVVVAGIGLTWAVVGGSGAFAGEGPEPSAMWMVANLVSGFLAAFAGGWVARKIGRSQQAVKILAGLIILLGIITAITAEAAFAKRKKIDTPVAEMSFMEAGQHARQPGWYNWIIPLVGVAGVWIGGREKPE